MKFICSQVESALPAMVIALPLISAQEPLVFSLPCPTEGSGRVVGTWCPALANPQQGHGMTISIYILLWISQEISEDQPLTFFLPLNIQKYS